MLHDTMTDLNYSLFEQCNKENLDDGDDSHQFVLKGSFQDLVGNGWSWSELFAFVDQDDKMVWSSSPGTPEECCVMRASSTDNEKPGSHEYALELIVETMQSDMTNQTKSTQKLQLTAPSAEAASPALHGLFHLVSNSKTSATTASSRSEITCKCFATQPRAPIPRLRLDLLQKLFAASSSHIPISCLRFHFVSIDEESARAINGCGVGHVEFRQCSIASAWDKVLTSADDGLKTLSVSCAMPEFAQLGSHISGNSSLEEMDLLLHFWLQGPALETFANGLATTKGLRKLKIQYLDINDQGWDWLCQSLHSHPTLQRLELGFTENFVDNFRRLTPERRLIRTKSVLKLVQTNHAIREVVWPQFQQDETTIQQVNSLLEGRKSSQ